MEVIVSTTDKVLSYSYYPGYIKDEDEINLPTEDWGDFNLSYQSEYIFDIPVQDDSQLGRIVYTEYLNDLKKYDSTMNVLIPFNQKKTFEQIKKQLIMGNPKLECMPDCILKSFPAYYNNHDKDLIDIPMRTINTGIVLRADINGDESKIVVMEILQDGTKRYITESEGFFYYETDTKLSDLKEVLEL